jgi:hypothetical protein
MGGPAAVNANGQYRAGMCGNAAKDSVQHWNVPGPIEARFVEGQQVDFEVVITAHHLGYALNCDSAQQTLQVEK